MLQIYYTSRMLFILLHIFSFNGTKIKYTFLMKNDNRFISDNLLHSLNKPNTENNLYYPKTINQQKYFDFINNPNMSIVIGVGPSGTGKTLLACCSAIQQLKNKKYGIDKIILTRPIISVDDEDIGYLPGDLNKKMGVWIRPFMDILTEFYDNKEISTMIDKGIIEISPLAYMRGRTFKNAFIIADEMQNSSPNQMLMIATRIGDGSKLVITGDLKQSDKSANNGLLDLMNKVKNVEINNNETHQISMVELELIDIERSPIVTKIINLYENKPVVKNNNFYFVNKTNINNYGVDIGVNDCALIPYNNLPSSEKNK